ncbi:hypothetical protein [Blastopirellula marina]|uniref:hypothetical protein n=1 Tax=Blastopirellula marina TaxID=124 RepID=UPI0011AFF9E9|nr:hypothetical protein [Blastopirellula marina]
MLLSSRECLPGRLITMPYLIHCECGEPLEVTATQAGSTVTCRCGKVVDVPMMSVLRRSAGESAMPLNIVEQINGMVKRGELPTNDLCPISQRRPDLTVYLDVRCEQSYADRRAQLEESDHYIIPYFLFGWIFAVFYTLLRYALVKSKTPSELERHGHDVSVKVPLAISSTEKETFTKTRSQARLKQWLESTPIYVKLLEEYPQARVTTYGA